MRTAIKFCGLTRVEDIEFCCELAVDAIGLTLVPSSPRSVTLAQACELAKSVSGFTQVVALVRNPSSQDVEDILGNLHPSLIQFHGSESPGFCDQFKVPYVKAISFQEIDQDLARYQGARAFVIDGHPPGAAGGSGQTFDWGVINRTMARPVILAGGLEPRNVAAAIRKARPGAVDCASGIEASPGVKDHQRIRLFIKEVHGADNECRTNG